MEREFYHRLQLNPIIATIECRENFEKAIKSPCEVIFLVRADILNLGYMVKKAHNYGKEIFIHVDLIDGFSNNAYSLKYIHENIKPNGIITTKPNIVKIAKNMNMFTIQRLFMLDHLSLEKGIRNTKFNRPNVVEILPGIIPKITKIVDKRSKVPVITGGLIMDKKDVIQSLKSGAIGISTSKEEVWYM